MVMNFPLFFCGFTRSLGSFGLFEASMDVFEAGSVRGERRVFDDSVRCQSVNQLSTDLPKLTHQQYYQN